MRHVLACLAQAHNPWLVALAAFVCVFALLTAGAMLQRDRAPARGRSLWHVGAAVAFGSGVWSMHFISMLAFRSPLPLTFRLADTIMSLLIALLGSFAGMRLIAHAYGHAARSLLGGMVLGLTISAMHYAGMAALIFAGVLVYDARLVATSIAIGIAIGGLAGWVYARKRKWIAALLLALAIVELHFGGMAATTLLPLPIHHVSGLALPPAPFALAVAAMSLMILALSFGGALVDHSLALRLLAEAARSRLFADGTFEGIFFHRGGRITDANAALGRMLGADPAKLVGRPLTDLFPVDLHAQATLFCQGADPTEQAIELHTDGGQRIAVELLGRSTAGAGGMVAVRDVRERKAAEQRIRRLAQFDLLTGLVNRIVFLDRISQSLTINGERDDASFALLCINLDRFKAVNDTLGHPCGDEMLMQVGQRLSALVRDTDTLARLGGDEFAIIQHIGDQPAAATGLGLRIVQSLSAPFTLNGLVATIGASVGIALAPRDGETCDALMSSADVALDRAKLAGTGTVCLFEPDMDRRLQERRRLELDLRAALAAGALHLHYQPVCDRATLRVVGHEALLRWTDPVRGVVSPAEMIPVAEESGLIIPLGAWVLETACQEAMRWPEPLFVAVNLSPRQFRDSGLAQMIAATLRHTGLPANRLELEVTESSMVEDTRSALAALRAIKALGVRLSLDDFGTGFSSLGYLRRFPFDKIKIDQSFVSELDQDANASAVIGSIVALGHSLHLTVTVEGVETAEQLAILQSQSCDTLQGYLLGRPVAHAIHATQADGAPCPPVLPLRIPQSVKSTDARPVPAFVTQAFVTPVFVAPVLESPVFVVPAFVDPEFVPVQ